MFNVQKLVTGAADSAKNIASKAKKLQLRVQKR